MSSQPAANDPLPPAVRGAPPAPPAAAAGRRRAVDARRRVVAALFASAAALGILVAFAVAWIYPLLSPAVAAAVVVVSAVALWGAARVDHLRLRADLDRLAAENRRLAARLESLADTAWELRESEERYRSLIDAQGDLVVRRDADGSVTFVNPAFARAFGRPPAALIGAPLTIVPPLAPVGAAGATSGVAARDVKLDTATGPRWYSWVDIRMRDEVYSGRPRHHRAQGRRAGAGRRPPQGGSGEPGEVARARHRQPRVPHAAERHPRPDRPPRARPS